MSARPMPLWAEINVTPLIDVLMVLLIIFMVVAPVATRGLDVAIPGRTGVGPRRPPPVLGLDATGITLDGVPVATLDGLEARLRDLFAVRSDHTLFVEVSGEVPYGQLVEALDVARGAGAERIGLLSRARRTAPRSG